MPRKLRELLTDLRRAGWVLVRQGGSHQTWQHPGLPAVSIRLSGNDDDDAKPYQDRDVSRAIDALRSTTNDRLERSASLFDAYPMV